MSVVTAASRYLSPEPLLKSPAYVRLMAPTYAYALNNPLRYFDPTGLEVVFGTARAAQWWDLARRSDPTVDAMLGEIQSNSKYLLQVDETPDQDAMDGVGGGWTAPPRWEVAPGTCGGRWKGSIQLNQWSAAGFYGKHGLALSMPAILAHEAIGHFLAEAEWGKLGWSQHPYAIGAENLVRAGSGLGPRGPGPRFPTSSRPSPDEPAHVCP